MKATRLMYTILDANNVNKEQFETKIVNHKIPCKLFIMRMEKTTLKIKTMNIIGKMAVRGTLEASGYEPATAQIAVCTKQGKVIVKIGLSIFITLGCYGRSAPCFGLAVKKLIDVGA